jgi:metal-dependent hydrolase (beta-lactamase superfamily II)
LHADHINGLEKFAYYKNIATPHLPKTKLFVPKSILSDLWDSLKHGLSITTDGKKSLYDYFDVVEVETSFMIGNQSFHIQKTKHVPGMDSYGLYVENLLYFSGDSLVDEAFLSEIEHKVNLIFHDCHLWDLPIKSHASLDDIEKLPKKIQEKMILMHYQDGFQGKDKADHFPLTIPNQVYEC